MDQHEKLIREINNLAGTISLLTHALEAQQQANAILQIERDQLCGALTQANLQMAQMMRF